MCFPNHSGLIGLIVKMGEVFWAALTILTSQVKLTESPSHTLYPWFGLVPSQRHGAHFGGVMGAPCRMGLGKPTQTKHSGDSQMFKPSSWIRTGFGLHMIWWESSFRSGRFVLGIEQAHPISWEAVGQNEAKASESSTQVMVGEGRMKVWGWFYVWWSWSWNWKPVWRSRRWSGYAQLVLVKELLPNVPVGTRGYIYSS